MSDPVDFSEGKRAKVGRPRKYLGPAQIEDLEKLAQTGATRGEMAAFLEIDENTLARRLQDQPEVFAALARANARMRVSIRRKQLAIAMTDGHPAQATMLIWCGKVILGQSERITLKIQTTADAIARLKEAWPEIEEGDLVRQLLGAGDVIDTEAQPVEAEAEEWSGSEDSDGNGEKETA